MNYFAVVFAVFLCLATTFVECQNKPPQVGKPQFSLQAAGSGKNHRNFQAGYNAGVGTRVWESKRKDMSLDVGASYGRGFARMNGHTFKSKPQYGLGASFKWGKK
ncbi:unnamed protein product [Larinioides sclopetarius]|uniref:Uncharacterized protein n=1 Tax=Larinioides sclopetarius TaxID=280406 RepID=A0AAV2BTY0_9ARAC